MNNKTKEGENFDLVFTSSWANDYYPNAKEGDFLNLNNLIKEYGKDVYRALDKKFWEGAKNRWLYICYSKPKGDF